MEQPGGWGYPLKSMLREPTNSLRRMPWFHRAVRYCSLRYSAALFAYIDISIARAACGARGRCPRAPQKQGITTERVRWSPRPGRATRGKPAELAARLRSLRPGCPRPRCRARKEG